MTTNKKFKQRVRRHMELTGRTYTQSYAQVSAIEAREREQAEDAISRDPKSKPRSARRTDEN